MARRLGATAASPPWAHDLLQLVLLCGGLAALGILYAGIHSGLLMQPDMQAAGAGSSGQTLRWIAERVSGTLPQPWRLWVPIWFYRVVMLLWALWLASRPLRWLPWCWQKLSLARQALPSARRLAPSLASAGKPNSKPAGPPPASPTRVHPGRRRQPRERGTSP